MNIKNIHALLPICAVLIVTALLAGSCGRSSSSAASGTSTQLNKYDRPTDVTASPDGTKLYVANNLRSTISIVDPATLAISGEIPVSCAPRHLVINAAGTQMYVGHDGASCKTSPLGTVYGGETIVSVVDLATKKVTKEIDLTTAGGHNNVRELVWDTARSQIYAATFERKDVAIIDTATQAWKAKVNAPSDGCLVGIALSSAAAAKQTLLAGGIKTTDCGDADNLAVIDPSTGAKFAGSPWVSSNFSKPGYVVIASNDKYAFVSNYGSNKISVIDITSPDTGWTEARYLGDIKVDSTAITSLALNAPATMALTADNNWLVVLNSGNGTLYSIPWSQIKNGATGGSFYGYSYKVGSAPSDVAIIGDYAYVTDQGGSALYKIQFKSADTADYAIPYGPVTIPAGLQ